MGQGQDATPPGDEFDAIRARVDEVRREAMARIEALRDPGSLDVRLPRLPAPEPRRPATPAPRPPVVAPAPESSRAPETGDRPAPPLLPPVATPPAEEWRAPRAAPVAPVPPAAVRPSAPVTGSADEPVPAAPAGRVIPLEDLPPPGAGWDAVDALSDLDDRRGREPVVVTDGVRVGSLRAFIEGIATRRTVWATLWQLASVVVLVAAVTWLIWFPLAAGEGSQALVVPDDRMAPTITRGAVVVITPSPDLPYPLDTIVALDVGGVVVLERIVDERLEDERRILITRGDGVAVGPNREIPPDQVVGAVRRITPVAGYPALWFDEPGGIVWRVLLILVLIASAIGAASLVVRAELRRQDRLLVSAIASGDRTPLRR